MWQRGSARAGAGKSSHLRATEEKGALAQVDHSGVAATDGPQVLVIRVHPSALEEVAARQRRVRDARTQLSRGRRGHDAGADRSNHPTSAACGLANPVAATRGRAKVGDVRVATRRRVRQAGAPDTVAGRKVGGEVGEGHLAQLGPANTTMAVGRPYYFSA